jgi:tRNA-2-methylthio-N6-dimethylallyladenosine synthase
MPLQSGSTEILKAMKRGYTKEWFINRASKLRDLVPDLRITTDIIVAFPGETDKDYEDTLEVVNTIKFDQIFNFKYSPRPGTEALNMEDKAVPNEIASARLTNLIELHKRNLEAVMPTYVGETLNVLVETLKPNGEVCGFTDNYLQVFAKGSDELLGKFVNVKVISNTRTSLKGEIVQ